MNMFVNWFNTGDKKTLPDLMFDLLSTGNQGTNFKWNLNQNTHIFILQNAYVNVVSKLLAIFDRA